MKKVFYLFLIGSAMLICPLQSKAESYSLVRTVIYVGQKIIQEARLLQDHSVLTLQLM